MHDAAPLTLSVATEKWPLKAPFQITGYTMIDLDVVVVTLGQDGVEGRGEAAGVYYFKDDVPVMLSQIERVRASIEAGIDRIALQQLLPAGGARNALDCALWDLEAKRSGRAVWEIAGLEPPRPLLTAHTVGANDPLEMASGAVAYKNAKLIKLKLTGEPMDVERIRAVRAARPDVTLAVDANQGFTREFLLELLPVFIEARISLVEQPFKVGQEAELDGLDFPIPIAADESAQTLSDVAGLVGRFSIVNIKLDKSGGLTEALAMAHEARRLGLEVMVGNMTGTALAMAPAFLVGQLCQVVDLDGPLLLRADRTPGVVYAEGNVWCPESIWGAAT
jgi:L-alanine-DL-glutamate epimerase-like enolase superfamily enzyme